MVLSSTNLFFELQFLGPLQTLLNRTNSWWNSTFSPTENKIYYYYYSTHSLQLFRNQTFLESNMLAPL
ncbi:hypothetical protein CANARDRAFT_26288 [[Candida] arabinofermentans NRRL YB-2248]|uniref:Uncharacterized protein n=1 Tax=[Candida] arabinofermentans NRRL YB-2248 TaxID=983967 RepID=A0A1E4T8Q6_9ASCO|nr:hypothetical protein CANARDRAFT_26288 [[Candida] arabinofermentans NRRL YB-2248]